MYKNYQLYRQNDKRWGKLPYPNSSKKYTIGSSGCGPTSIAMLASAINPSITPKESADWLSRNGYAVKGTSWSGIIKGLEHFGYKNIKQYSSKAIYKQKGTDAEKQWRKDMQAGGKIAILNMGDSTGHKPLWTTGGHYITVLDARMNNGVEEYYVQDPGGRHNDGWFKWKDFEGYVRNLWTTDVYKEKEQLVVDGNWGVMTTKSLQKVLRLTITGTIVSQPKKYRKNLPACSEKTFRWVTNSKGSYTIKIFQKKLGVKADGKVGPKTIKALQKILNVKQDGICGLVTVKALQKWINKQL